MAAYANMSCSEINIDTINNRNYVRATINISTTTSFNENPASNSAAAYAEVTASSSNNSYTQKQFYTIKTYSSKTLTFDLGPFNHNTDGSLGDISVNARVRVNNSYNFNLNGTIKATNIARKTACPNLSGDIESSYNIALNPASSNFTHSLYVTFGNIKGYINASGNLQSNEYKFSNRNINFTIPPDFYQQFSGKSGSGKLTLTTYNGSTNIGSNQSTLTANCLESRCRPSICGTIKDINSITKNLTGNENKLIKGFSNALISLNITSAVNNTDGNSTIISKNVDGITFTNDEVTIHNTLKKDFTITAVNSRGFSTTIVLSASGNLVEYFKPSIVISPYRYPDQTSSNIRLTYSGSFFNENFGNASNALTMKWYWKKSTDTNWTLGGNITPTINENTINEKTINCGNSYDYQNAYRFKLEVVDSLTNEGTKEEDVLRGEPIYSHGENWFQFHVDTYNKNGCKISELYPIGSIYLSINETNPKDLFGGTWEQIKDKFLLSCGNTYKNGETGGSSTKTLAVENIPSHNHSGTTSDTGRSAALVANVGSPYSADPSSGLYKGLGWWDDFNHTHRFTTNNTGGGKAFNILPPYLVVYMWKRIA